MSHVRINHCSYLLLLHKLRVGAIVHHILTKNRCGKDRIDFLCVDILQLPIENEIIALSAKVNGGLLPKQNEGENIAIL